MVESKWEMTLMVLFFTFLVAIAGFSLYTTVVGTTTIGVPIFVAVVAIIFAIIYFLLKEARGTGEISFMDVATYVGIIALLAYGLWMFKDVLLPTTLSII